MGFAGGISRTLIIATMIPLTLLSGTPVVGCVCANGDHQQAVSARCCRSVVDLPVPNAVTECEVDLDETVADSTLFATDSRLPFYPVRNPAHDSGQRNLPPADFVIEHHVFLI